MSCWIMITELLNDTNWFPPRLNSRSGESAHDKSVETLLEYYVRPP